MWFRESPEAYAYSRSNDVGGGIARESARRGAEDRTLVEKTPGEFVWVPTALLRSSPPRWATGKQPKPKAPRPHVRKEAIRPEAGVETTIFDHLGA